jgi:hypothetical protein
LGPPSCGSSSRTTRTADGFQLPVLSPLLWPLQLLLNTLQPAFIVNELASKRRSSSASLDLPPELTYPERSPLA